jgi:aminoglycoside phosphotransferase (APT) family kinase protein
VEEKLRQLLDGPLGAVRIEGLDRLSGGASRETWRFDAVDDAGTRHELILRRDPPGRPSPPGGMGREAAAMRACTAAGLAVPTVVADLPDGIVMARVDGETLGRRILRDDQYAEARGRLAGDCGRFLAGLHALDPAVVPGLSTDDPVVACRRGLDLVGEPSPTFELAFRWLERHRPEPAGRSIVHGDLRLGNLIVGPEGLRAVLDWELLHEGDPLEDLGWLCTKAWRFGAPLPVGGFATRDELVAAYETAGGAHVEPEALRWWEVLGSLKWGIGCMGQAGAHLSGLVRSVELAAVGRRVCEQEWDLLLLLAGEDIAPPAVEERPAPPGLHGRPTAVELLEAVRGFLRDDVMPGTDGRLSFHARVAANVIAIVERELLAAGQAPPVPFGAADDAELAALVRAGSLDDRLDEVAAALVPRVGTKLAIANPRYAGLPDPRR